MQIYLHGHQGPNARLGMLWTHSVSQTCSNKIHSFELDLQICITNQNHQKCVNINSLIAYVCDISHSLKNIYLFRFTLEPTSVDPILNTPLPDMWLYFCYRIFKSCVHCCFDIPVPVTRTTRILEECDSHILNKNCRRLVLASGYSPERRCG